jgi:hypothetical protein
MSGADGAPPRAAQDDPELIMRGRTQVEAESPDSVIAHLPKADVPHEMHGFVSSSHGPLLVLIMQNAKPDIGVYDAATGAELSWFRGQTGRADQGALASHVYQGVDGPVLALATDDEGVRQFDLPAGRPVHASFEPGGRGRALSSYRDGAGRIVLVVADAEGDLRRFDAATGTPVGDSVRFGPEEPPPAGLLARLTRRKAPPESVHLSSRAMVIDDAVLVVDRGDRLWRVLPDAGTATEVPLDPELRARQVMSDPLARPRVFLINGPGFAAFCNVVTGRRVGPLLPLGDLPDGVGAAVVGGELKVYASTDGRILRFLAGTDAAPYQIFGPPPGTDHEEFLEDLCVLPVGERTAVLVTDGRVIRRFDAATDQPWGL